MDLNKPAQGVPANPNAPAQGTQAIDMQAVLQQMQQQAALMQQQAADITALQVQLAVVQALGNLVATQVLAFALMPASAQTEIIDFISESDIKLCKTITMPLMTLYNGLVGTLVQFLNECSIMQMTLVGIKTCSLSVTNGCQLCSIISLLPIGT